MKSASLLLVLLLALFIAPSASIAQRNAPSDAPFIIEHSYWLKPGKTPLFLELFRKNKLPLLQKEATEGRILWMRLTRPRLRSDSESQPDVRLTIAWRDSSAAWDDKDPSRFADGLYEDLRSREREERERDELVLRRSDVPVQEENLPLPAKQD